MSWNGRPPADFVRSGIATVNLVSGNATITHDGPGAPTFAAGRVGSPSLVVLVSAIGESTITVAVRSLASGTAPADGSYAVHWMATWPAS